MQTQVLAAIHSFDSPNKRRIKPVKWAPRRKTRKQYNNYAPLEGHEDKRGGASPWSGGLEEAQVLVLSSTPPPPVPPVPGPGENYHAWCPDDAIGKKRCEGWEVREKEVTDRLAKMPTLYCFWKKTMQCQVDVVDDPKGTVLAPGGVIRRTRVDIGDSYAGFAKGTYTHNPRYAWLPAGIDRADPAADPKTMYAVGCTCRDMMSRGALHACHGCKHTRMWNACLASGKLRF